MTQRTVEVFTAGCTCCDETLKMVQSLVCPNCELTVLDMRSDRQAQAKAKQYGVQRVPAVAVDGKLAGCCQAGVQAEALRALGVGRPA